MSLRAVQCLFRYRSVAAAFLTTSVAILPISHAAEITDATGRTVNVPDHVARVLPAGPPAGVLLTAIAPAQMVGLTDTPGSAARAALPNAAANLSQVPRLTAGAKAEETAQALHPDLIIDYGTVSPRYQQLARETQEKTGIPTLLFDGTLDKIPEVARTLGRILHQPDRAEAVAQFAEAILALPLPAEAHPKVLYARGPSGTLVAAPNTEVTALFTRLGWQVVAPEGNTTFRPTTPEAIGSLNPDIIILADPAAKTALSSPAWASLRAVRDGHAYIAPSVPYGWIEEPPSINRLLGLAWLRGADPLTLAAVANADLYGRTLTQDQILRIAGATPPIKP